VEIPEVAAIGKRKYPFDRMEVGDSFFLGDEDLPNSAASSLRSSASRYSSTVDTQARFTIRRVDGGYRAWRVQ